MSDSEKFSVVELPPRVSSIEHLNEMLLHMENLNGNDLFVMGGSEVWAAIYGKKVKISNRKITDKEAMCLIEEIYGSNAPSKLGTATAINTAHEFRTKEIKENGDEESFRHRFRVNAVSCLRNGRQSITITTRTIPTTPPSVKNVGVEKAILDTCRNSDQGLILIVGATGNGKSTLLASVLRDQLEDVNGHRNLVTIEAPIEFVYDDIEKPCSFITQLEVGRHIESFHDGVINSLRMAPTTILVGESRDYETASAAIEASVTGHVVFSTVHANSVAETIQRLVALYPQEMQSQAKYDIIQALKLVVAQRLIPTVNGKRVAIREYLIFTQEVKDKLLKSSNVATATFNAVEEYGRPMMVDVEEKLNSGIISQEVYIKQKINYEREKQK